MAKPGVGFLADLVAKIVGGIQGAMIAPLALAFGSQAEASDVPADKAVPHIEAAAVAPVQEKPEVRGPEELGKFTITFYYVVGEDEVAKAKKKPKPANDNQLSAEQPSAELAATAPPDMVTIYAAKCEPITEVSRDFAQ